MTKELQTLDCCPIYTNLASRQLEDLVWRLEVIALSALDYSNPGKIARKSLNERMIDYISGTLYSIQQCVRIVGKMFAL